MPHDGRLYKTLLSDIDLDLAWKWINALQDEAVHLGEHEDGVYRSQGWVPHCIPKGAVCRSLMDYTALMTPPHRRKLKRIDVPGHARYLTFSCYRRLPLFNNDRIKDAFTDHLRFVRSEVDVQLFAWVVMPEHVHLLVLPGQASVTTLLRRLKSPFGRSVISRWQALDAAVLTRVTDSHGGHRFWQRGGGYDRNIATEAVLHQTVDYIHANPIRRGLVKREMDWRWSSARWYAGERDCGPNVDLVDL